MADAFSPAQIVGYVAFAITIAAFWQKRDKPLLLLNALGAVFWTMQFIMLGAWTGAVTEVLVGIRSALSAYMREQKHRHLAAAIFLLAFTIGGLVIATALWTVYNSLVGTIGGVMTGVILILTQIITLARMHRDKARAADAI